ncbi:MAG: putative sulfate exporter family transporter [Reyranella sp.]|uniref:YeiH family protein n=1 Tax=Reyranella sp. TaxID=1929291 RepID=UPI001ACCB747|nr:putative sulfate exporter family transporter [Reyranella sp.]MBN9090814.1 putative sulfate exporter family transporter [Reyranella sp.]
MASNVAVEVARLWAPDNLRKSAPGILLCCAIAAIAFVANANGWMKFGRVMIPPLIVTLVIGMCLQPLSAKAVLKPGLEFAGRTLLRIGVALYGAQLTLGQLVDGGALPVVIAIAAVGCTIVFGAVVARAFGLTRDFGFLTGCATGVCGAAAAMATSAVLPRHANSDRDLAFAVMGVNFISTITMVIYPTLHTALGYSNFEMGVFLGGAIHDVAQVAGAGETLGKDVLAVALITKLLRVACLLPAVTVIAWWVARGGEKAGDARPAPPVFLFGFLLLALVNSVGLVPPEVRVALAQVSSFLIITAIAALGIKTSLLALVRIGMGPVMLLIVQTIFIGLLVAGLIYGLQGVIA